VIVFVDACQISLVRELPENWYKFVMPFNVKEKGLDCAAVALIMMVFSSGYE
jgi:hypothetical protein